MSEIFTDAEMRQAVRNLITKGCGRVQNDARAPIEFNPYAVSYSKQTRGRKAPKGIAAATKGTPTRLR